jgi:hypothetical protein
MILFLLAALFIFPAGRLSAQEPGYYIQETEAGPRLVQRLSWEPEEYASYYEVRIEKRDSGGNWSRSLAEITGENFIEVSLSPGSYRYQVQAYDLMERPAGNPPWIPAEVISAFQPELENFVPDQVFLDNLFGKSAPVTLTVKGRNLTEGAEFRLVPAIGKALLPTQYISENTEAVLVFSGVPPGNYELLVVNPGGLSDSLGTLRIYPPKKTIPLSASLGYAPLIPLYGRLHKLLDAPSFPAGGYGGFSLLPIQTQFVDMGFEAAIMWTYIFSRYDGGMVIYDVNSHSLGLEIYYVFEKALSGNLVLDLRLGAGIFSVLGFEKRTASGGAGQLNALVPVAGGGLSLRWFFFKPFFAEMGMEYTHFFSVDNPSPGYLRPTLGIGFSR